MQITIKQITSWEDVKTAALATVGKQYTGSKITDKWKRTILRAEHSPIRALTFEIGLNGIPYYSSVHFSRHSIGVTHYVTTQRTDRTGIERAKLPQGTLVNHKMILNAQALINISRKRLCGMADEMTFEIWDRVKDTMLVIDENVSDAMICECLYRGFCPEFKPCGFSEGIYFPVERSKYVNGGKQD